MIKYSINTILYLLLQLQTINSIIIDKIFETVLFPLIPHSNAAAINVFAMKVKWRLSFSS